MLIFLVFSIPLSFAQLRGDSHRMLNWCLKGSYHKSIPGPEDTLYKQCSPWKDRSCCSYNTTLRLHNPNSRHHNFNFDHCGRIKNISENCRRHFIQDLCFYECSPNIGPWVVKIDMKTRKERFYKVPLCKSDCDSWFEACKDDFTCTENWMRYFLWDKGGNRCFPGAECATFQDTYGNAEYFCQTVWDDAWLVVDDSRPCMKLWFDESKENPNNFVAAYRTHELLGSASHNNLLSVSTLILYLVTLSIMWF